MQRPAKADLNLPQRRELVASNKFVWEIKIPAKDAADIGYLRVQVAINVEGEIKQQGGVLKTSVKKDQIKFAIEQKVLADMKASYAAKFDEKSLKPIADAIAAGSKKDLLNALFKPFEASIKSTYRLGGLSLTPEEGLQASSTPLFVRPSGEYEGNLLNSPYAGKFTVKGGFNVGLSVRGWKWVGQRVGLTVLRAFLAKGGRALAGVGDWLVAEGVLTTAGILSAVALGAASGLGYIAFCAWLVDKVHRKGELQGLATWYGAGYAAKVFDEACPTAVIPVGDVKLRDELVQLGEMDAVTDARAAALKTKGSNTTLTEEQVLKLYRSQLLAESRGDAEWAKRKLKQALDAKMEKILGV
jgi:hypothetical protein